jgi:hypothetical protein
MLAEVEAVDARAAAAAGELAIAIVYFLFIT